MRVFKSQPSQNRACYAAHGAINGENSKIVKTITALEGKRGSVRDPKPSICHASW